MDNSEENMHVDIGLKGLMYWPSYFRYTGLNAGRNNCVVFVMYFYASCSVSLYVREHISNAG